MPVEGYRPPKRVLERRDIPARSLVAHHAGGDLVRRYLMATGPGHPGRGLRLQGLGAPPDSTSLVQRRLAALFLLRSTGPHLTGPEQTFTAPGTFALTEFCEVELPIYGVLRSSLSHAVCPS